MHVLSQKPLLKKNLDAALVRITTRLLDCRHLSHESGEIIAYKGGKDVTLQKTLRSPVTELIF